MTDPRRRPLIRWPRLHFLIEVDIEPPDEDPDTAETRPAVGFAPTPREEDTPRV